MTSLSQILNFIPKSLGSVLNVVLPALKTALNFDEKPIMTDYGIPISSETQRFMKSPAAVMALQVGITPETLKETAPKTRLAAAGMLAEMALPTKGIGQISTGLATRLPGSKIVEKGFELAKGKFGGFKDLTTKFLDYAKGKTTLSKQEIMDFARRPELKKGEADLLMNKLEEFTKEVPLDESIYGKGSKQISNIPSKLPTQEFADSIRRDLLELKPRRVLPGERTIGEYGGTTIAGSQAERIKRYGNTYEEVVFQSGIKGTSDQHYSGIDDNFAWARGGGKKENGIKVWEENEIQSGLLQKDNLDRLKSEAGGERANFAKNKVIENTKLSEELPKLDPFTNDRFGERIMRERIKAKAQAGYEKYRLPTGETIGKIEGFSTPEWSFRDEMLYSKKLTPEKMKAGMEVQQGAGNQFLQRHNLDDRGSWIITDILGDGRFKAVPGNVENAKKAWTTVRDTYTPPSNQKYLAKNSNTGEVAQFSTSKEADKYIEDQIKRSYEQHAETFDLTGKSNPQYRRYENWGKFLKNKYGGKEVVDANGNSWVEIDLTKEHTRLPIEAFGIGALGVGLGAGAYQDNSQR